MYLHTYAESNFDKEMRKALAPIIRTTLPGVNEPTAAQVTHCNTLQRIATLCNTLQNTATHTAAHCNTLHTAAH